MKTVGIIAEYNPFHNGHKYHVTKTREQLNAEGVIAVMSGNFTQRGEIAMFDMHSRAEIAVKNGVDLVLELPPQFVLNSAEFYAYYGIYLLNQLGIVNYLSFGSECGDLSQLAAYQPTDNVFLKQQLKTGISYAKAISDSPLAEKPNNILGIEYLRALKKLKSEIQPFTVLRKAVEHHSQQPAQQFASASWIRSQIRDGNSITEFLPNLPDITPVFEEQVFTLLKYRLITGQKEELSDFNAISEGLQNRILANRNAESFSELITKIKCKRYPETRIRRALYSLLLNLKKSTEPPTYTRVLAFNDTGKKLLREIKKKSEISVLSRITKKDVYQHPQLQTELYCNEVYDFIKKTNL